MGDKEDKQDRDKSEKDKPEKESVIGKAPIVGFVLQSWVTAPDELKVASQITDAVTVTAKQQGVGGLRIGPIERSADGAFQWRALPSRVPHRDESYPTTMAIRTRRSPSAACVHARCTGAVEYADHLTRDFCQPPNQAIERSSAAK